MENDQQYTLQSITVLTKDGIEKSFPVNKLSFVSCIDELILRVMTNDGYVNVAIPQPEELRCISFSRKS